jgi:hypothetical protein
LLPGLNACDAREPDTAEQRRPLNIVDAISTIGRLLRLSCGRWLATDSELRL